VAVVWAGRDWFFCLIIFKAFCWVSSCPNPLCGASPGARSFSIVLGVPLDRGSTSWVEGTDAPRKPGSTRCSRPRPLPAGVCPLGRGQAARAARPQGTGGLPQRSSRAAILPGICNLCPHTATIKVMQQFPARSVWILHHVPVSQ